MRRIALALAASALATASLFASSAAASGPAPAGKQTLEIECAGLGVLTVSVPRPETSKGVGQIVRQQGHGKPVSFTFTVTDVTTKAVLFSEAERSGGGKAHANQATTQCSGTNFEGPASVFFEGQLPPEVQPTDLIRASFEASVVIKP